MTATFLTDIFGKMNAGGPHSAGDVLGGPAGTICRNPREDVFTGLNDPLWDGPTKRALSRVSLDTKVSARWI